MDLSEAKYLGDGLYATHDGYQFWLLGSDGIAVHDKVALDSNVLMAFLDYVQIISDVTITVTKNKQGSE